MTQRKVRVIEPNSNETIFTCDLDQIHSAYEFSAKMEGLGIDTIIKAPSLPESLIIELGATDNDITKLNDYISKEIQEHSIDSCCISDSSSSDKKK